MTAFICTVGNTQGPILYAIREAMPSFVYFICSEDDRNTGAKGSYVQVEGDSNNKIESLAKKAGLSFAVEGKEYQTIQVPTDDLAKCHKTILRVIDEIRERFPDEEIIANYSGGPNPSDPRA